MDFGELRVGIFRVVWELHGVVKPGGIELGATGEGLQGGGALSKDVGQVRGHLVAGGMGAGGVW